VVMDSGQFAKARVVLDEAGGRAVRFYGATSAQTALIRSDGLRALIMTGRPAEAAAVGRDAAEHATHNPGLAASEIASVKRRLALALVFAGREKEALALLHELAAQEELGKDRGTKHAYTLLYTAGAENASGHFAAAASAAHEAAELFGSSPPSGPFQQAKAQLTEAMAFAKGGDPARAESLLAAAEVNLHTELKPDHPYFLFAQLVRAEALRARGDATGAERMTTAARDQLKAVTGADIPGDMPVFF